MYDATNQFVNDRTFAKCAPFGPTRELPEKSVHRVELLLTVQDVGAPIEIRFAAFLHGNIFCSLHDLHVKNRKRQAGLLYAISKLKQVLSSIKKISKRYMYLVL